jgi:hypothetical protein
MSFHFANMTMMTHRWASSPHPGHCAVEIIMPWMEDVALIDDGTPCRDEVHFLSILDVAFFTLDAEVFDDDVTH